MKKTIAFLLACLLLSGLCACTHTGPTDKASAAGSTTGGTNPEEVKTGAGQGGPAKVATGTHTGNGADHTDGDETGDVLTGKIAEVRDGAILLACEEQGLLTVSLKDVSIFDENGGETTAGKLAAGMQIALTYSGIILETYPAKPAGVSVLRIVSVGDDLVGLYMQVVANLYDVDPGLNGGITTLAFDLSNTANLSPREKEALVYLAGCQYGLETVTGTYEELCEEGYIDAETLSFNDGLLITIDVTSSGGEGEPFLFDAQKWRGGDGAYFFSECEAKLHAGAWTYTVGAEMIS